MEKIHESYEDQLITRSEFIDRKTKRENQINELMAEICDLSKLIIVEQQLPTTKTELLEKVEEFKQLWQTTTDAVGKNKAFQLLVEKIVYDRVDNNVSLTIFYK